MSDELRAAGDQLREDDRQGRLWPRADGLVIRAWLADHPADDALPVDEAWLRAAGGEANQGVFRFYCGETDTSLTVRLRGKCPDVKIEDGNGQYVQLPHYFAGLTRGQFRRLAAALGVPLTEGV
jgi:hypothetical protein